MKIVLTRESEDNRKLACMLKSEGIETIDYPCIATVAEPPTSAELERILHPGAYDAIVFTSRRAATIFGDALEGRPLPSGLLVAAVGEETASILRRHRLTVDLVSSGRSSESLGSELAARLGGRGRVLHVRGNLSTGEMREAMERKGISIDEIIVYRNVKPHLQPLEGREEVVIVCASPSAAERFLEANPNRLGSPFVAIGAMTGRRLRELGARNVAVAVRPDNESLREAIISVMNHPRPGEEDKL